MSLNLSFLLAEVVQWDIDDVCRWLEELGLGEYCDSFHDHTIVGTKLLGLRKSDLQVGAMYDTIVSMVVIHVLNVIKV